MELRAGTGGDEAGIFVGDLFRTYVRYAELKSWKVEIISSSENNFGGYKEVIALIKVREHIQDLSMRAARIVCSACQKQNHKGAFTLRQSQWRLCQK